jgi:hypothetical protein
MVETPSGDIPLGEKSEPADISRQRESSSLNKEQYDWQAAVFEMQVNAQRQCNQAHAEFAEAILRNQLSAIQPTIDAWSAYQIALTRPRAVAQTDQAETTDEDVGQAYRNYLQAQQRSQDLFKKDYEESLQGYWASLHKAHELYRNKLREACQIYLRKLYEKLLELKLDTIADVEVLRMVGASIAATADSYAMCLQDDHLESIKQNENNMIIDPLGFFGAGGPGFGAPAFFGGQAPAFFGGQAPGFFGGQAPGFFGGQAPGFFGGQAPGFFGA